MKKISTILAGLLVGGTVFAGDSVVVTIANTMDVTNSVAVSNLTGYIESIDVDVTGTTTEFLTFKSKYETVLTNTVTADGSFRPRKARVAADGTAISTSTDQRVLLVNEALTITCVETNAVTNSVTIRIVLDDK